MHIPILFTLLCLSCLANADRVIHKEKSLYRNIVVKESGSRRCLVFALKRGDKNQTCKNLKYPNRVVFPYARMTFAGLLLNPEPGSILVIGLGGGTIPTVLSQLYPEATIDIVEIDEAVKRVAEEYFNFIENDRVKVIVRDARVYIKRAGLQKRKYDMVILDAFTGDYIPEHLTTVEFLEEVSALLSDNGVLVANTFSTSKLYHHESVTYSVVFGDFFNFKMPITGNRVIIANGKPLPSRKQLQDQANKLAVRLKKYNVNIGDYPKYMSRERDWDESKRPLTDQFAPANLLRNQDD